MGLGTLDADQQHAEQLGQEQQDHGRREQRDGLLRLPARPQRVELVGLQEVLRHHQRVDRQQAGGQQQEQQP
ncbi:hypothetical protein D9M69_641670 [compost metagenome]